MNSSYLRFRAWTSRRRSLVVSKSMRDASIHMSLRRLKSAQCTYHSEPSLFWSSSWTSRHSSFCAPLSSTHRHSASFGSLFFLSSFWPSFSAVGLSPACFRSPLSPVLTGDAAVMSLAAGQAAAVGPPGFTGEPDAFSSPSPTSSPSAESPPPEPRHVQLMCLQRGQLFLALLLMPLRTHATPASVRSTAGLPDPPLAAGKLSDSTGTYACAQCVVLLGRPSALLTRPAPSFPPMLEHCFFFFALSRILHTSGPPMTSDAILRDTQEGIGQADADGTACA